MASSSDSANSYDVHVDNSTFNDIGGNQVNIARYLTNLNNISYQSNATVFDLLKEHVALSAVFNSAERESEHASTCQEGTRTQVLEQISQWVAVGVQDRPICWLEGPAGAGKSTIAQTIAQQCADQGKLAFTFFFSRGKLDRDNTRKFFPTCAYQLAESFPVLQPLLRNILINDPSIPSRNLELQIQKLIDDPAKNIETISMVIIVDGLDECGDGHVLKLMELLTNMESAKFCFLFTSRPEDQLVQFFRTPTLTARTFSLSLRDFDASEDVCKYLRLHLDKVLALRSNVMQAVPRPWPSERDLEILVEKSEHLFIYVSTLVKFVGEERGLPQERLQVAIQSHTGLDAIYEQILSAAADSPHFNMVLGAVMHLLKPLSVHDLAGVLQLAPCHVQVALRGCYSVLAVPEPPESYDPWYRRGETIRPYHASLRDFLTNMDRSGSLALPLLKHHTILVASCINILSLGYDGNGFNPGYVYACQYWVQHFSLLLRNGGSFGEIEALSQIKLLTFIKNLEFKGFKQWMYGLETHEIFLDVMNQCKSLHNEIPATSLQHMRIVRHIKNMMVKLKNVCNFMVGEMSLFTGTNGLSKLVCDMNHKKIQDTE